MWIERAGARRALVGSCGVRRWPTGRRRRSLVDAARGAAGQREVRQRLRAMAECRVRDSVATRLRHRRTGLRAVPRQHRARQRAHGDRLDAQSRDPVLRLRRRAQHGSPAAAGAASCRCPPAALGTTARSASIACSCTRSAAPPSPAERRVADAAIADPARPGPSVGGWTRRSAVGGVDEARIPVDLLK